MKKVYFNKMQWEIMWIAAKISVAVAGRGTGKGPLLASVIIRNVEAMPRSTGAYITPDAIKAKTNTIPSMTWFWEKLGYKEGIHWVIGIKPPKKLCWPEPLFKPQNYENVISFFNGSILIIVPQSRAGTSNSKSFDYIIIDEAKFIDFEQLKNETFQANRGQIKEYGDCPWHHGITIASDMPTTLKGSWFLRYEKMMDKQLIKTIRALNIEIQEKKKEIKAEGAEAPEWKLKKVQRLEKLRKICRSKAIFFKVYSSLTNIEVLGEEYIAQQRRDLPDITFYASILGKKPENNIAGFYVAKTKLHNYKPKPTEYAALHNDGMVKRDCRFDSDILKNKPLCIALDFNKLINNLVVGQEVESEQRMNTVNCFFVKYKRRLKEIVSDFCDYYEYFPLKEVIFYYDHTAKQGNKPVDDLEYKDVVIDGLRARNWTVHPVYIGRTMRHSDRHLLITRSFNGEERLVPRFNEVNCENLLIALDHAGVYNNEKDKRREKYPESDEDRLEWRTDFTDAWDTLLVGMIKFPWKKNFINTTSNWSK